MPLESNARLVSELASRGYNAEREAITLLAGAPDSALALEAAVEHAPDDALRITTEHVRAVLDADGAPDAPTDPPADAATATSTKSSGSTSSTSDESRGGETRANTETTNTTVSTPDEPREKHTEENRNPVETRGSTKGDEAGEDSGEAESDPAGADHAGADPTATDPTAADPTATGPAAADPAGDDDSVDALDPEAGSAATDHVRDPERRELEIGNDMTGYSTGTGEYDDFVQTFRDRYERLSKVLRGRVNHRPANSLESMPGGSDAAMIGLVNDVRSTKSGHWLIELEDTTGTFPALVMKDKGLADVVDEILMDECVAVDGTLADDSGILFADSLHFPDIPRTHRPGTADRHVQAALISDVHVGSDEFMADAWSRFTDWLHTPQAAPVEYLLLAGDMVEGVGVYPNQDDELDIIDIYEQYEVFAEYLKEVPADMEIVMIPGNHDAVRLAEPQPGFDDELRDIMDVHDARIVSNPATVSVEGVDVLMYHGVSLDEVIAELPEEKASYDEPHKAMYQLLKKRHVAPQFGGHTRVAPEERDYLVIDDVPDVFHTGHVHKLGWGKYHNVLAVNSGCWQAQTDFQKSVNIQPDSGYAPILDLDTLEMTVRKFA